MSARAKESRRARFNTVAEENSERKRNTHFRKREKRRTDEPDNNEKTLKLIKTNKRNCSINRNTENQTITENFHPKMAEAHH